LDVEKIKKIRPIKKKGEDWDLEVS
jgi:hypothetical protein